MRLLARLILWDIPVWFAYIAVSLVLDATGLVLIAILAGLKLWTYRESKIYDASYGKPTRIAAWRGGWLTWLWGNEEDGVLGPDWWVYPRRDNVRKAAYERSALRNPSNNMRFIPGINPVIEPRKVWYSLGYSWTYVSQGPFAGFVWYPVIGKRLFRFWVGWKLKIQDIGGVPVDDMRRPRCGFALQFKRVG